MFIGIDPGKSGAIAIVDGTGLYVASLRLSCTESDVAEFFATYIQYEDMVAYIERVHSMPRQGVASSFKFGMNYGFLRGMLIAFKVPFEEVGPAVWQGKMSCRSGGDKNVTKARAQQLFPAVKITHANADALLIAEYGRRKRKGEL